MSFRPNFAIRKISAQVLLHIEAGRSWSVVSATATAEIRRNPYFPGEYGEEEKHDVRDIRVYYEGREISPLDWEEQTIYEALVEAFEEKEQGEESDRINAEIDTLRGK